MACGRGITRANHLHEFWPPCCRVSHMHMSICNVHQYLFQSRRILGFPLLPYCLFVPASYFIKNSQRSIRNKSGSDRHAKLTWTSSRATSQSHIQKLEKRQQKVGNAPALHLNKMKGSNATKAANLPSKEMQLGLIAENQEKQEDDCGFWSC